MTLIKSISGIRGTIGGDIGDSFTPIDIVKFTSAYAKFISLQDNESKKIVLGRDARLSGFFVSNIVSGTLIGCGFDVVDIGLSTTPTVEIAVEKENAAGGIIITASHNPTEWNGLKFLDEGGCFVNPEKIPQMNNAEELVKKLPKRSDVSFSAFILNQYGLQESMPQ